MKNYEKYADEIREYEDEAFCNDIVKPHILGRDSCADISCEHCHILQMIWLLEECEETKEPKVDWSKVEVDTPILVRTVEGAEWTKRHFAKYEDGMVYVWTNGKTSWTLSNTTCCMSPWEHAKLAESEEK